MFESWRPAEADARSAERRLQSKCEAYERGRVKAPDMQLFDLAPNRRSMARDRLEELKRALFVEVAARKRP